MVDDFQLSYYLYKGKGNYFQLMIFQLSYYLYNEKKKEKK